MDALADQEPTWFRDQVNAAADDAHAWMQLEASLIGSPVKSGDVASIPGWMRLGVLTTYTQWAAGLGSTCMHNPTIDSPEPVFATAWQPGLVACARCIHLTVLRPGSKADRTCDGCGHVVAGLQHGEGIYPGRVQLGPLVYAVGTCKSCRPADDMDVAA
jgi:hypothetical protein